jgi:hypothetical protein
MAALTKTQLEHAKAKVEAAYSAAMTKFVAALGTEPDEIQFTDAEKRAMVLDGRAKPDPKQDFAASRYYVPMQDVFIFPKTGAMIENEAAIEAWNALINTERARLNIVKEQLIDELVMSPDGMSALTKIAAAFA